MTSSSRPGHIGTLVHVGVYVLLAALVVVDYVVLSQALLSLNQAESAHGPITTQMYVITAGVSVGMVLVPHLAAWIARRVHDGIFARRGWLPAVFALLGVSVAVISLITYMRIASAAGVGADSGLGLQGETTAPPSIDPAGPGALMAYLMALLLVISSATSFVIMWATYRPLRTEAERARREVEHALSGRDEAADTLAVARGTRESLDTEKARDEARWHAARGVVRENLEQLRMTVAATIVEAEGDPERTTQMLRNLRRLDGPSTRKEVAA
jgi:hypothetical protein